MKVLYTESIEKKLTFILKFNLQMYQNFAIPSIQLKLGNAIKTVKTILSFNLLTKNENEKI